MQVCLDPWVGGSPVRPTDRFALLLLNRQVDLTCGPRTSTSGQQNTHTDRSAITALTAQNSHEVRAVQTSSLPQLRTTLEALGDDFPPQAVKLGMLATAEVCGVCEEERG